MTDPEIRQRLARYGQEHLLQFADELHPDACAALYSQIGAIDFDQLKAVCDTAGEPVGEVAADQIQPIEVLDLPRSDADRELWAADAKLGEQALRDGRTAVLLVAGGQGSRLGFEHPKGMFPIGAVRGTSLFQIFAEKIRARAQKAGCRIPWYIMTSPTNRVETEEFFVANRYFGLKREDVRFFVQGTMPAVDAATNRVLLAEKGNVFVSPNGHGGTLMALKDEGILNDMARRGVDLVYFFQVDNPFVEVLEPAFFGHHLRSGAEFSAKVVRKRDPHEKVGLVVRYRGVPTVIEYSDLPSELATETAADGGLKYWPGSIAIHIFSRPFLERVTSAGMPFHIARKAVPYVDENGRTVTPTKPNAVKFEMFIFDCMPLAERVCIVETDRQEEFEPVKNASGQDSPESVRAAMNRRAGKWLKAAGVPFAADADGNPSAPVEISPLAGLDAEDFASRDWPKTPIAGPTYYSVED